MNSRIPVRTPFLQKIALTAGGILLCLLPSELGLRLCGFFFLATEEYRNKVSLSQKHAYSIMCLGESTTAGQYPRFLEEILNQRNTGIQFSVIDKGMPSTTTQDILTCLEADLDTYRPDIAVVMMGVNDELCRKGSLPDRSRKIYSYNALSSSKVYNLIRLLWLHIQKRSEEIRYTVKRIDFENVTEEGSLRQEKELPQERGYADTAEHYLKQGDYLNAKEVFKKALSLNPLNIRSHLGLARAEQYSGQKQEAEKELKKATQLAPDNERAYLELGWYYRCYGKYFQAERAFKRVVELKKNDVDTAYLELASIYLILGRYSEAERAFKERLKINPQDITAQMGLAHLYEKTGIGISEKTAQKIKMAQENYYDNNTTDNFKRLKAILDRRGVKLVCVQYPMRSLGPLKDIFLGEKGAFFVDNEMLFKKALSKSGYNEYFIDMFAGDFGHCTEKGNRLLANNIADTILKEVFKK